MPDEENPLVAGDGCGGVGRFVAVPPVGAAPGSIMTWALVLGHPRSAAPTATLTEIHRMCMAYLRQGQSGQQGRHGERHANAWTTAICEICRFRLRIVVTQPRSLRLSTGS